VSNVAGYQLDAFSYLALPIVIIAAAACRYVHESTGYTSYFYLGIAPNFLEATPTAAIAEAFPLLCIHFFELGSFPPHPAINQGWSEGLDDPVAKAV